MFTLAIVVLAAIALGQLIDHYGRCQDTISGGPNPEIAATWADGGKV